MTINKDELVQATDRWAERGVLVAATIGCLGTYVVALAMGIHGKFSFFASFAIAIAVIIGIDLLFAMLRRHSRRPAMSRTGLVVDMTSFVLEHEVGERLSA
ncbi:MAG: hypothetical protein ACP5HZ_12080 [Ferrimicrobium sp.]